MYISGSFAAADRETSAWEASHASDGGAWAAWRGVAGDAAARHVRKMATMRHAAPPEGVWGGFDKLEDK